MPVLRKLPWMTENRVALRESPAVLASYPHSRMDRLENPSMADHASSTLFPDCANGRCKSGWMKLWRSRQVPVFEGKWACSPACMQELVKAGVQREMGEKAGKPVAHQHRVPLGLLLLSQGHISQEQLKRALESQKKDTQEKTGTRRLGAWLMEHKAVDEEQVTRALGAQWNCPVFPAGQHDPAAMALLLPRLLIDSFGVLPLRRAGRSILYVAFEDRIDRCVTLAIERMSGLAVEAGVVRGSEFRRMHQEMLGARLTAAYPRTRLIEATGVRGLVHSLAGMIEERKPVQARLVRVHDYFWLRLWRGVGGAENRNPPHTGDAVEDLVCLLAGSD